MSEQTQSAATPEQTNGRLSITYNASKDHYCFFCEEGGRIIECSICDLGICYEITDQTTNTTDTGETVGAPDTQCCISVPADMVRNRRRKFRCPQCLSGDKFAQLDYTINRGYRATRRMAIKSAVVIIVYHLKHLRDEAEALTEQLCAYLQVFEIHVVTEVLEIHNEVGEEYALRIRDELLSKSPYHLAVLFFTESDPRGGWWIESAEGEGTGGRATEQKFIKYHTNNLMPLASEAATARIFAVTCGMNMFNDDSIRRIYEALNERPWHSAVFPYAPSILPTRYIEFFPEMFVHLFYFGAPLRSALLRTWAKSFDARQQTGLLVMDRVHWRAGPLDVRKIEHAPFNSRPYGHELPIAPTLCGCWDKTHHHWRLRFSIPDSFGEWFGYYTSSCCSFELHVAIYAAPRALKEVHGTNIVEEIWDKEGLCFPFEPTTMVWTETSPHRDTTEEKSKRPVHEKPWTITGKIVELSRAHAS